MEITAAKKDLLRILTRAQGVADKKSTIPILANILLDATGEALRVCATDLYLSVSGSIPAKVTEPGTVALPAKDLVDRIKAMPDGPVSIACPDGGATTIKSLGSARRYTLHGLPGADFPPLPDPSADAARVELPADLLATMIARTQFSISADDSRPNLNSALFERRDGVLRMVSTDGHRLSKMEAPLSGDASVEMLLPLRAVVELRRIAEDARSDGGASVVLVASGPNAFFETPAGVFSVKTTEAVFPSYKQVVPAHSPRVARIPRAQFADALRAVSLAANDRTGGVKFSFSPGVLRVTSESPERGNGADEIAVDYSGVDVDIGFNAKFFLDALGALEGFDDVAMSFDGPTEPAVIRACGEAPGRDYMALVMPMRI